MFLNFVFIRVFTFPSNSTAVEYIFDFMCPRKERSYSFKSRDRGGHEIVPPLPNQLPVAYYLDMTSLGWKSVEKRLPVGR